MPQRSAFETFLFTHVHTPTQARPWLDVGIRCGECAVHVRNKVETADEAQAWKTSRIKPGLLEEYRHAGITHPLHAAIRLSENSPTHPAPKLST